jgi:methylated-DNA-[protein]-cysteine S-methyltransferase
VQFTVFETAIGWVGVAWRQSQPDSGIAAVVIAEPTADAVRARMAKYNPDAAESEPPADFKAAVARITAHLAGELDDLRDIAVDLDDVSEWRREVYEVLRDVDPGETITYGEIAGRLGNPHAAREVGQAMGSNPVPIVVPCHRCLAADNKMGGFSAPGGIATKLRLLAIEGAATPEGQTSLF